jgi:hypothetical protein
VEARQLGAEPDGGPYHGVVETAEQSLLSLVQQACKAGFGSADACLDMTPYQLLRLLGAVPHHLKPKRSPLEALRAMPTEG